MATTTNFGWTTPDDTDLVKDGAAAIRTLGSSIDTSLVDLKGGTTGQVLTKASGTDLDFNFTTPAGNPITTEGDLIIGDASGDAVRLPIGSAGTVLTSDGDTADWAAPAALGANWSLVNAGGTALTGAQTVTVSGISAADKLMVLVEGASSANSSAQIQIRFNSDDASNYYVFGQSSFAFSVYAADNYNAIGAAQPEIALGTTSTNAASTVSGFCLVSGCNASGVKVFNAAGGATAPSSSNTQGRRVVGGYYNSASAISSITIRSSTGNLDAGTVYIYKSA